MIYCKNSGLCFCCRSLQDITTTVQEAPHQHRLLSALRQESMRQESLRQESVRQESVRSESSTISVEPMVQVVELDFMAETRIILQKSTTSLDQKIQVHTV